MERLIATLSPDNLFRVVRDIFVDELARSRGTGFDPDEARGWGVDTTVREDGLALDSLERFTLAGRLNETFSLFDSGVEDNLLRARTLGDTVDVIRAGLDYAAPAIAFYSGGTTGTPRPQRHATELLEQEISVLTEIFAGRRRVIVTVPVHHIYGFLFGVLLPTALGVPAVDAQRTFLAGPRAPRPGDLVVSVPFLWERLGASIPRWGGDVWGISSTAPLPAGVAADSCAAGLARLVEIYGSSETGGIARRDRCDGPGPFTLFPYWHALRNATDGETDHVLLRDPPGGGDPLRYEIPDRLRWHDERRIETLGRRDAVVQVGGENVDLEALRRRIVETVPECAECAVRPGDDGRIRAFLVPVAHASLTADEARRALRERFPAAALPADITIGTELPRDATGKLTGW